MQTQTIIQPNSDLRRTFDRWQAARRAGPRRGGALPVVARELRTDPPRLYEHDGDTVYLNLHAHQYRAYQSAARIVAMIAGSQGGKTSFGPWWLNQEITRRGKGDYIAATASYDLFKLKMLPEIREVFEHVLKIGRYWAGDKIIELADPDTGKFLANRADDPMWGRIILRSAVASGGLESATAKGAWLDEFGQDDVSVDAWDAVIRRLTLYLGRILLTTTLYNLGWLVQQIVHQADDNPDVDLIQFESTANPAFPEDEFERLRRIMPKWKFNMFMRGLISRPPGMIYEDFIDDFRERGGHKVEPFDIPIEWPRLVGVDPGVIHTCKVWLARNPANEYFLYRESIGDRKSMVEHAKESLALADEHQERVIRWAVGARSEIYHRQDWIAAGAKNVVEPAYSDVEAGIDKVIGLLRDHRLYIFKTCEGTLDQFGRYRRKLDKLGNVTEEIADKETFHYLDALRYVAIATPELKPVTVTTRRWA